MNGSDKHFPCINEHDWRRKKWIWRCVNNNYPNGRLSGDNHKQWGRKEHWRTLGRFKRCDRPITGMGGGEKDNKKENRIEDWAWPRTFKKKENCRRRGSGAARASQIAKEADKMQGQSLLAHPVHIAESQTEKPWTNQRQTQQNQTKPNQKPVNPQRLWGIGLTSHMTGWRSFGYEQK